MSQLPPEVEQWAEEVADRIATIRGIDPETAKAGALWGCFWIEAYKIATDNIAPGTKTRAEMASIINEAYTTSRAQVNVPSYPSGAPSLTAVIAAIDTFCLAFGAEEKDVRELLGIDLAA